MHDARPCLSALGRAAARTAATLALCVAVWTAIPARAQLTDTARYLALMDVDGDGRVGEQEYVRWMLYAFDRMDADGDGVLAAHELPGGKGRPIARGQQLRTLAQRFHLQDANGDGCLDARELAAPPR